MAVSRGSFVAFVRDLAKSCIREATWNGVRKYMQFSDYWYFRMLLLESYSSRSKQFRGTKIGTRSAKGLYYWRKSPPTSGNLYVRRRRVRLYLSSEYTLLTLVATQSSCPTELPKSTKVKLYGNNEHNIIIVHMLSADAQTNIQMRKTKINLRTSWQASRKKTDYSWSNRGGGLPTDKTHSWHLRLQLAHVEFKSLASTAASCGASHTCSTYTHTHTRTCTHTRAHTLTHTHTHTHKWNLAITSYTLSVSKFKELSLHL